MTLIIGIGGGSASGKTSIAKAIAARTGCKVPIVSQDWFYHSLADKSMGPTHNWDLPDAFNTDLIISCIQGWKNGIGQWTPRHDYSRYEQIADVEFIQAAPVMIFEGILAFENKIIRSLIDIKIYIECDIDIALTRRIIRDVTSRGYELKLILERYCSQVKPAFETYVEPMKKSSDIIIYNNGTDNFASHGGIELIVSYIKSNM